MGGAHSLAMWLVSLAGGQDAALPVITVPMALYGTDYWDRPIEVCGHVVPSRIPQISMLYDRQRWLMVDPTGGPPLTDYSIACVKGVMRRRDGLSARVARERGIPRIAVSHGASPDVILRRCSDPPSCVALLPE